VLFGFKDAIRAKVFALSGHLLVDKYAISQSFEQIYLVADDSLKNAIRNAEGVQGVYPFVSKAALLKAGGEIQGIVLKGVEASFQSAPFTAQIQQGRMPRWEGEGYSNEIVMSSRMARLLNVKVGEEGLLFFLQDPPRYRKAKIVGLYSTGMQEFDDRMVYADAALIQRINQWSDEEFTGMEIFLNHPGDIEKMEQALFDQLPADLNVTSVLIVLQEKAYYADVDEGGLVGACHFIDYYFSSGCAGHDFHGVDFDHGTHPHGGSS